MAVEILVIVRKNPLSRGPTVVNIRSVSRNVLAAGKIRRGDTGISIGMPEGVGIGTL